MTARCPESFDLMYDILEAAGDFHLAQILCSSNALESALDIALQNKWVMRPEPQSSGDRPPADAERWRAVAAAMIVEEYAERIPGAAKSAQARARLQCDLAFLMRLGFINPTVSWTEAQQIAALITKKDKQLFVLYSLILLALWIAFVRGLLIPIRIKEPFDLKAYRKHMGLPRCAQSGEAVSGTARGPLIGGSRGALGAGGSLPPAPHSGPAEGPNTSKEEALIKIKMNQEKTTKQYVVYAVAEGQPALGKIYIQQSALERPFPAVVEVELKPGEAKAE